MARMQRTQIYLEPDLAQSLDELAQERGTSRANIIRLAARQFVAQERSTEDHSILGIIGIGRSGLADVSERHDEYLARDMLDEKCR